MLLIGLLILVAAAAFAGVLMSENWGGGTFAIKGFGHVLGHYTLAQIFISGIVLTAIFFFGLWAASVSTRIRRRASSRRRAESRAAREEHDELVAERDRLARDLAAAQRNTPVAAPVAAAPVGAPAAAAGQAGLRARGTARLRARRAAPCHRGHPAAERAVPHPAGPARRRPAHARRRGLTEVAVRRVKELRTEFARNTT